jgi:hypothetical protein
MENKKKEEETPFHNKINFLLDKNKQILNFSINMAFAFIHSAGVD